jgi:hypothetical protein
MIEKMVALAPERADEFWAMFKHLSKDNALRMIEELQAEKEERKRKLPAQPLAVKLLVNRQSNQQLRADLDAELEREAKGRREVYQMALEQAIEEKFAWQQRQEAWGRRYDPMGLWGPPNYKTSEE